MKERKTKQFSVVRVATRNIVVDSFQWIRNMFGLRLRGYEKMIQRNIEEVTAEAFSKYKEIIWHRLEVNNLSKDSVMIIIYGEHYE